MKETCLHADRIVTLADVSLLSEKGEGVGGNCEETSDAEDFQEEAAALEASFGKVCGSESAVMFTQFSIRLQ